MNVAFPALLILVLVLPGVILRYNYRKGFWQSPIDYEPLTEGIPRGIFWAGVLHLIWSLFFSLLGHPVDLQVILTLLAGARNDPLLQAVEQASAQGGWIAAYFLTLYFGAAVLGLAGHGIVRGLKLDHRWRWFRFDNRWFYILQGEYPELSLHTRSVADSPTPSRVDLVYVSAVLDQGGESFIYYGRLLEFYFGKDGSVDILVLTDAYRRRFNDDRLEPGPRVLLPDRTEGDPTGHAQSETPPTDPDTDSRYYGIDGDLFIIRYSEVKTLNVQYFSLEEAD